MKTIYFTTLLVMLLFGAKAQTGVINNGAKLIVSNGAVLKISGVGADYTNNTVAAYHGVIDLDGKIELSGDWYNNASSGSVFINTDNYGDVVFNGSVTQIIGGSATTSFENLMLSNSYGVVLNNSTDIGGNLTLSSGILRLGNYDLVLSSSSNVIGSFSSSTMIATDGTGSVIQNVSTVGSTYTIPVGDVTNTYDYSPITIKFTSGTFNPGAYVSVSVSNTKHPYNSSLTSYLNRYWKMAEYNISGYSADISATYVSTDVVGTEMDIYGAVYDAPYWDLLNPANSTTNVISGTVTSISDITGAETEAVLPAITITDDGDLNEGAENGELITVKLVNDDFIPSLNSSNWTLYNLPDGVSKGTVTRVDSKTVTIELSGNRTVDFDTDITNVALAIKSTELVNYSGSDVTASSGVVIKAVQDVESISMADDGLITEGNEDGEIITVSVVGGTFAPVLNQSNWSFANLPAGVSVGSINRINETTVEITLSGNSTSDYDTDITNTTLTINAAEVDEYTGADLSVNTGVVFTAIDESLVISMTDDGLITEGSENDEVITVTISGRVFATTLTKSNWTLNGAPAGITIGNVIRDSDTQASVYLSGNRTQDYDVDITNMSLKIELGEIDSYTSDAYATSGVTFTAIDDAESIIIADDGDFREGYEDGEKITVTLTGGTFVNPIDIAHWSVNNLPQGVSLSSIARISATEVQLTLAGNRTNDYDTDITDIEVTVTALEVDDTDSDLVASSGVVITANNDVEELAMSNDADGITEGSEDGEKITVTLTGGTFVNPLTPSNWSISNQPVGVSLGSVTRMSDTEVQLTLSGISTSDYDTDITNFEVTVSDAEVNDYTGSAIVINTGVVFTAIDESANLFTSTEETMYETNIDSMVINILVRKATLITGVSWQSEITLNNAPLGLSVKDYFVLTDTTAKIVLAFDGIDFDIDYNDFSITLSKKLISIGVSATGGNMSILAILEPSATVSYDGNIVEGYESGEMISVDLGSGRFVQTIPESGIIVSGLPSGVTVGRIIRVSDTKAELELSGDSDSDYDTDITGIICSFENTVFDRYEGSKLIIQAPVIFTALNEHLIIPEKEINENELDGAEISLQLSEDKFEDSSIDEMSVILNNPPIGLAVSKVSFINDTLATLTLSYSGADITENIDFSVTLKAEELHGNSDLESENITILASTVGVVSLNNIDIDIYSNKYEVYINIPEININEAEFLLTDMQGKVVYMSNISSGVLNKVAVDVKEGAYIVRVMLNGNTYMKNVYIGD